MPQHLFIVDRQQPDLFSYLAREFSIDATLRQSYQGEPITHLFFGFKYHLESAGVGGVY